ncbi:MAG TPA: hypothetical protein VL305_07295 [Pseudolabrys sp.]|nr:hypothetical protein [Pseudolabrys sp.]
MRPLIISAIAFVLVLGGALLGMYSRRITSADHLRDDVKDVVRLSTGLIGTIAALVLGLLIASAKNSYDARTTQFKQITANVILLDLLLEQYGLDAQNLRGLLRIGVPIIVERITNEGRSGKSAPFETTSEAQRFVARIQDLKSNTEAQHALQVRIVNAAIQLAQSRLALFTQTHDSIPAPFLTILIFWLTIIFASFGLFVRPVPIVVITFVVGALSVSGALFLILEMDQPFAGLFQIPTDTLSNALAPLGN